MRWILKAAVQGTISLAPQAHELNYFMQKHVSRRLPQVGAQFDHHFKAPARHLAALEAARPSVDRATLNCYEFGAGWDLIGPISMWALGVERQTILDIRANLKLELVNATIRELAADPNRFERVVGQPLRRVDPDPITSIEQLAERFGLRYLAPADARAVPLPDRSIDFVTSTFTLEHIPSSEIAAILTETRRLLSEGAVISSLIDMQDHYHYVDPNVSVYHFLRYPPSLWRLLNPSLQWQSRLRHSEYLQLFRQAGFAVISDDPGRPTEAELQELRSMPIADCFRRFAPTDLGTKSTHLVAEAAMQ